MVLAASADSPNYTLPTLLALATLLGVLVNIGYSIYSRRGDREYDREQRSLDRDNALEAVRLTLADAADARRDERVDAAAVREEERKSAQARRFEQRILDLLPEFDAMDDALTSAVVTLESEHDYGNLQDQFPEMIKFVNNMDIYAETQQTVDATRTYSAIAFELWERCRAFRNALDSTSSDDSPARPMPDLKPIYDARAKVLASFREQLGLRHHAFSGPDSVKYFRDHSANNDAPSDK